MDMKHSFVKQKWNIFQKCLVCRKMFGSKMWRCIDCPFRCHAKCATGTIDYEMADRQSISCVNEDAYESELIVLEGSQPSSIDKHLSTELIDVQEKDDVSHDKMTTVDPGHPVIIHCPKIEERVVPKLSTKEYRKTILSPASAEFVQEMIKCRPIDGTVAAGPSTVEVKNTDWFIRSERLYEFFPEIRESFYNGYFFGGH